MLNEKKREGKSVFKGGTKKPRGTEAGGCYERFFSSI